MEQLTVIEGDNAGRRPVGQRGQRASRTKETRAERGEYDEKRRGGEATLLILITPTAREYCSCSLFPDSHARRTRRPSCMHPLLAALALNALSQQPRRVTVICRVSRPFYSDILPGSHCYRLLSMEPSV